MAKPQDRWCPGCEKRGCVPWTLTGKSCKDAEQERAEPFVAAERARIVQFIRDAAERRARGPHGYYIDDAVNALRAVAFDIESFRYRAGRR